MDNWKFQTVEYLNNYIENIDYTNLDYNDIDLEYEVEYPSIEMDYDP